MINIWFLGNAYFRDTVTAKGIASFSSKTSTYRGKGNTENRIDGDINGKSRKSQSKPHSS